MYTFIKFYQVLYLLKLLHVPIYFQYLNQKKNDQALKMWLRATEIKPTHLVAWSNILVLLDRLQQYENVIEYSAVALEASPKAPSIHFTLANVLGKLERWQEAEYHFKQAILFNPKSALYHSNLGNNSFKLLFILNYCIVLINKLIFLGVLYHRWGKIKLAEQMYEAALQKDPLMNSTRLNLNKIKKLNII